MADFKYEIVEEIAVLSESSKGWTKELNLVSFSEREPVFDLRGWKPQRESMGKGLTLTKEEAVKLRDALNNCEELK